MFLVAQIPILKYQMYDAYVELLSPTDINPPQLARFISFKMAYINPGYTDMQIAVRMTFFCFTIFIVGCFLLKLYQVPKNVSLTKDQKNLVWISLAGAFFNDPTYLITIFKPSLFSSVVSQFWPAWFFALLLKYWLRSVERAKEGEERILTQNRAEGVRKRSPIEIAKNVYFTLLVLTLLSLYAVYQLNVNEDPSYI